MASDSTPNNEKPKYRVITPVVCSHLQVMHITSFFQTGLSKLEAAERRKKLFEAEEERERKIYEELRKRQRELEQQELDNIARGIQDRENARIEQEKKKLQEELRMLELKKQDRRTNHLGKLVFTSSKSGGCLFVGSQIAATNVDWLQEAQVTAIMNVTTNLRNYFDPNDTVQEEPDEEQEVPEYEATLDIQYHRIPVEDAFEEDIGRYFEPAAEWIHGHLEQGRNVLVHCKQGQSRSCAIVVSYLILKQGRTLQEALDQVQAARPLMAINEGFQRQLRDLHKKLYPEEDEQEVTGSSDGSEERKKSRSFSAQMQEMIEQAKVEGKTESPGRRRRSTRACTKDACYVEDEEEEEPPTKKRKVAKKKRLLKKHNTVKQNDRDSLAILEESLPKQEQPQQAQQERAESAKEIRMEPSEDKEASEQEPEDAALLDKENSKPTDNIEATQEKPNKKDQPEVSEDTDQQEPSKPPEKRKRDSDSIPAPSPKKPSKKSVPSQKTTLFNFFSKK